MSRKKEIVNKLKWKSIKNRLKVFIIKLSKLFFARLLSKTLDCLFNIL